MDGVCRSVRPADLQLRRKHGLQDADAVDLGQEVISAVAGAIGRLEYDPSRGAFHNWLLTVVWRKLANWRRAERHRPHGSGDAATQRFLEQQPEPEGEQAEWEAEWERRVFAWACEQVRKDVTEATWQAFWRTAIDDQPGKQVAADLGLSVAAVYRAQPRSRPAEGTRRVRARALTQPWSHRMSAPLDCPGIECWQALFDDAVPEDQREPFERHLESCTVCQERLQRAEEGGDVLRRLGQQVGDPTLAPVDPTLRQFLDWLHEEKAPDCPGAMGPDDLYFLRPAEHPGDLGVLGPYEVHEVIGQGGMGVVLKAFDPALNRLVAIKVLAAGVAGSAMARKRFAREAQAAAAVCHDHVVTVHGVHEADGLPYLVMQYVAGESLQDRLDRMGALEVEEIVCIGLQTAKGLAAAHAQGLIHRDITPANLLLSEAAAPIGRMGQRGLMGRIRPIRPIRSWSRSPTSAWRGMIDDVPFTRCGVVAGTPEYMAPEQACGETVDHRADLFSLGSVLYAMCTGAPPFRASTPLAVLRQVSELTPTPLHPLNPDVPAWLEAFIVRLMAKNPADRFQSAAEVAVLLEGYLGHLRQPTTVPAPILPASSGTEPPGREAVGAAKAVRWSLVESGWSLLSSFSRGSENRVGAAPFAEAAAPTRFSEPRLNGLPHRAHVSGRRPCS